MYTCNLSNLNNTVSYISTFRLHLFVSKKKKDFRYDHEYVLLY